MDINDSYETLYVIYIGWTILKFTNCITPKYIWTNGKLKGKYYLSYNLVKINSDIRRALRSFSHTKLLINSGQK